MVSGGPGTGSQLSNAYSVWRCRCGKEKEKQMEDWKDPRERGVERLSIRYLHLRKTALILWSPGCRDREDRGKDTGAAGSRRGRDNEKG